MPTPLGKHGGQTWEGAWLDRINRQLAYEEYMQAKREFWLWERPPKAKSDQA